MNLLQKYCVVKQDFKASGTIKQIWKEKKRTKDYNIVGIVLEVKRTKSGGKMVTLEDMTGTIRVFVRKDDPASAVILNDDVLGMSQVVLINKVVKCFG